jgi:hypothetical protein
MKDEPNHELGKIQYEDIACSVNPDPNIYEFGIRSINEQNKCDIEKLVNEGIVIKVKHEPSPENWSWVFIGKNKFEAMKNELYEYYKINNPERLRLNPHLIDQIRFNTVQKKAAIQNLQQQLLNIENNPISFANDVWEYLDVDSWLYIINIIIEQPIYIIEAIEKYSDKIETNQRDYLRYEYINSKILFGRDKHNESSRGMQFNFMMTVKMGKGIDIKPLIYFFEGLIEELSTYTSGIDYIDTPLFRLLFSEFNVFYSREIGKYNPESFPNIEHVKKRLNELKPQQIETLSQIHNQIEIADQETKAKPDHSKLLTALNKYISGINADEFTNIIEHHSMTPGTPKASWISRKKVDAHNFATFINMTIPEFRKCFSFPDGKTLTHGHKDRNNLKDQPIIKILKEYISK